MKKILSLLLMTTSVSLFAATEHNIWMKSVDAFKQYQIALPAKNASLNGVSQSAYGLELIKGQDAQSRHKRYVPTFHDIPIWGRQVIVHKQPHQPMKLTGTFVSGIEGDLRDVQPKLTREEAISPILSQVTNPTKAETTELIIYIDDNQKAHTAYLLNYYTMTESTGPSNPHYIIDANDGRILKQWDAMRNMIEGAGPGGNTTRLPYREGAFQYGSAVSNLPSLGTFPMDQWTFWCYMQTPNVSVISLENERVSSSDLKYIFPIYDSEEKKYNLVAVNEFCMPWTSTYSNENDGGMAPVNGAYSPINDAMYFVNATLEMYKTYGVEYPLGQDDLPLRVYSHIGGFDNAFALPTIYFKNSNTIKAHQQIVVSNGLYKFTALTQSVIAHELSHNFTEYNSGLIYSGQSGGLNESFSDMAAMALLDYIRGKHPFYWDGQDWSFAREATKDGNPLRYIDYPSRDGSSIENAHDYKSSLDVHLSSGVFNRAFYLLANQPGWSIHDAFQVMVDANRNYWEPDTTFVKAAQGVVQATIDLQRDPGPVVEVFQQVGVL